MSSYALKIPRWLVKRLSKMPLWLAKRLGVAKSSGDYLDHSAIYDAKNTYELLEGSDIECPMVHEYIDTMIEYVKKNPEIPLSI